MKNIAINIFLASAYLFCASTLAQAAAAEPALASYDWSANSAHSLASNPPSATSVQAFIYAASAGGAVDPSAINVCDFRFADLHRSGNLSLVVSMQGGGTGDCNETDIFDKTPAGFEDYTTNATPEYSLRNSVQDINNDGNLELVLYGLIGNRAEDGECDWPLIFAWTGTGYAEVSIQYKSYYERYLNTLNKQIASYSSGAEVTQASAPGQKTTSQRSMVPTSEAFAEPPSGSSPNTGFRVSNPIPAPAPSPAATSIPEPDYNCLREEAAKTEAFLGIHSDETIGAAIKDSESEDPSKRILAAVLFSYIGSQEAKADLKTLANDSDEAVAKAAKERLSVGTEPSDYYRGLVEDLVLNRPTPKH